MENENISFLNEIHKNAMSGITAINALLPKTQDDAFTKVLQKQLHELRRIEMDARRELGRFGMNAVGLSLVQRTGMSLGVTMNTLTDKSLSNLAELMMKGNHMGVVDITRARNQNPNAMDSVHNLAARLLCVESETHEAMKPYL